MAKKKKVKKGSKKKVVKLGPKNVHWRNDKMLGQLKENEIKRFLKEGNACVTAINVNNPALQAFSSLPRSKSLLEKICEYFTA